MRLDPRNHAVRGDLADIRLADRIFAPHYAAAWPTIVARDTPLAAQPHGGEPLGTLTAGDVFEVLDVAGGKAWGTAPGSGLVGYIDASALARP